MQKHALQTLLHQFFIAGKVTVFIVTGNWVTQMGKMHTNLVGATCFKLSFKQVKSGQLLSKEKMVCEAIPSSRTITRFSP